MAGITRLLPGNQGSAGVRPLLGQALLPIAMLVIVLLMVVPVPALLLDVFFIGNILLSLVIKLRGPSLGSLKVEASMRLHGQGALGLNDSKPMTSSSALPPILAEGKTWVVIDKPAGLAVHPGPRTPHSLEAHLPAFAQHGVLPQLVHRLDRDTSGCLLLARRPSALRALSRAFAAGEVEKTYLALVEGDISGAAGRIDAPLLKQSRPGAGWRMIVDPRGQAAATRWRRIGTAGALSLIEFRPETGRTHQIRVHATLLGAGAALVGDPVYGQADAEGMMLHAARLVFAEPQAGARVEVVSPLPARFHAVGLRAGGLKIAAGEPAGGTD